MRSCSLSVDLDEVGCYLGIHGLSTAAASHAVYDVALPRIREFASRLAVPLTLFVVGRDLERAENAFGLERMLSDGHEIGNHSLDHLYDLSRRALNEQRQQVELANARLRAVLGVQAQGFRAPGYTVSDELLMVVRDCGMTYDSSVFPSPPYYAAKAVALFGMKLRGRTSRAVLDTPRVLRAPTTPYRIGSSYSTRGQGLLELPIQVAGPVRVPFIGTTLTLLGPSGARLLTRSLVGAPFVNLELHGLDFLEAHDVPSELVHLQPDLRVSWARKLATLSSVVAELRAQGRSMLRLLDVARAFSEGREG